MEESIADLRVDTRGEVPLVEVNLGRRDGRASSGTESGAGFRGTGVSPARRDSNPGGVSLISVFLRGLSHGVPKKQRGDLESKLMTARASDTEVMVGVQRRFDFQGRRLNFYEEKEGQEKFTSILDCSRETQSKSKNTRKNCVDTSENTPDGRYLR